MTVLFTCTMSGKFLPTQVIYAGKTPACLPKDKLPDGWNVTFTPNHWSNEETNLHSILILYVEKETCNESSTHRALVILVSLKHRQPQTSFLLYIRKEQNFRCESTR